MKLMKHCSGLESRQTDGLGNVDSTSLIWVSCHINPELIKLIESHSCTLFSEHSQKWHSGSY